MNNNNFYKFSLALIIIALTAFPILAEARYTSPTRRLGVGEDRKAFEVTKENTLLRDSSGNLLAKGIYTVPKHTDRTPAEEYHLQAKSQFDLKEIRTIGIDAVAPEMVELHSGSKKHFGRRDSNNSIYALRFNPKDKYLMVLLPKSIIDDGFVKHATPKALRAVNRHTIRRLESDLEKIKLNRSAISDPQFGLYRGGNVRLTDPNNFIKHVDPENMEAHYRTVDLIQGMINRLKPIAEAKAKKRKLLKLKLRARASN